MECRNLIKFTCHCYVLKTRALSHRLVWVVIKHSCVAQKIGDTEYVKILFHSTNRGDKFSPFAFVLHCVTEITIRLLIILLLFTSKLKQTSSRCCSTCVQIARSMVIILPLRRNISVLMNLFSVRLYAM